MENKHYLVSTLNGKFAYVCEWPRTSRSTERSPVLFEFALSVRLCPYLGYCKYAVLLCNYFFFIFSPFSISGRLYFMTVGNVIDTLASILYKSYSGPLSARQLPYGGTGIPHYRIYSTCTLNSLSYTCLIIYKSLFHYLLMCLKFWWMSGKQCRPGSDGPYCGVWYGSTLFAQACLSQYLG